MTLVESRPLGPTPFLDHVDPLPPYSFHRNDIAHKIVLATHCQTHTYSIVRFPPILTALSTCHNSNSTSILTFRCISHHNFHSTTSRIPCYVSHSCSHSPLCHQIEKKHSARCRAKATCIIFKNHLRYPRCVTPSPSVKTVLCLRTSHNTGAQSL